MLFLGERNNYINRHTDAMMKKLLEKGETATNDNLKKYSRENGGKVGLCFKRPHEKL